MICAALHGHSSTFTARDLRPLWVRHIDNNGQIVRRCRLTIGEAHRFTDCRLALPMPPVDGPPASSQTHRQGVPSLLALRSTATIHNPLSTKLIEFLGRSVVDRFGVQGSGFGGGSGRVWTGMSGDASPLCSRPGVPCRPGKNNKNNSLYKLTDSIRVGKVARYKPTSRRLPEDEKDRKERSLPLRERDDV
jgi:hypothetical protein